MAVYKQAEFCKLFGVTNGELKTLAKRGKVEIVDFEIDDTIPVNALFKRKMADRKAGREKEAEAAAGGLAQDVPEQLLKAKPQKGAKQLLINTDKEEIQVKKNEGNSERWDIETRLKGLTIEKHEQQMRMDRLKEEKLRGDLIPLKIASVVVKTTMTSVSSEMKKFIDDFVNIFAIRKDLTSADRAGITGETYKAFNDAVERAADNSEREMIRLAQEFSNSRGIGDNG